MNRRFFLLSLPLLSQVHKLVSPPLIEYNWTGMDFIIKKELEFVNARIPVLFKRTISSLSLGE